MSVKSKDELLNAINGISEIPEDVSISLIEDISDTLDSFSGQEDWKTKYEENDAQWKKKYRDRFFNGDGKNSEPEEEPEPKKLLTYESLFTTSNG